MALVGSVERRRLILSPHRPNKQNKLMLHLAFLRLEPCIRSHRNAQRETNWDKMSFFHLNDGKNASFVAFMVSAMYLNAPCVVPVWLSSGDFGVCLAMVAPCCRLGREITHQRYPLWSSQAAWSNALTRLSRRLLITMTATDPESEVGMQFLSIFWLICRSKSAIRAYSVASMIVPVGGYLSIYAIDCRRIM